MRKALIEAACANQAKADFLVTMSHKLRTPFNAIVGFSDMLAGQFDGPLGSKKYNKCAGAHQINLESI
ncbi:MAG: sensor histidine kinase, partial [Alphaproteobacteria bacterium]|nr:sensor histidine kinase [Alphaproteobacteria bacterium]